MVALHKPALAEAMNLAAQILHPKLDRVLVPGVQSASVGVSCHIQDGRLSHVKEHDEDCLDPQPTNGADISPIDRCLRTGLLCLQSKLEAALVGGYHGFVALTFLVNHGTVSIRCSAERVHKVGRPI